MQICRGRIKILPEREKLPKETLFSKTTQKIVNCFLVGQPSFFNIMYKVPGHNPEHRYNLLVKIVNKYVAIKLHKFLKNHNVLTRRRIRQKLTKLVHFSHQ